MDIDIDTELLKKDRKRAVVHLNIALREEIEYTGKDYFNDVTFIQNNLSPITPEEVDLSTEIFGKKLEAPIMISPLVGGFNEAKEMNQKFAEVADQYHIAMGVGNQIFSLLEDTPIDNYSVVRDEFPDLCVVGNVFSKYLPMVKEPVELVKYLIDQIKADGFEITLSPLPELFYTPKASRGNKFDEYVSDLTKEISTPIFARSYSSGFAHEEVRKLWDLGIDGIDSQGMGGADIIRMEAYRTMSLAEKQSPQKPKVFDNWGIHTLWSLLDIKLRKENREIPLIVGGGIRNGLQAAKCLAIGADIVSVGYPVLLQYYEDAAYPSEKNLEQFFFRMIYEIKMVMASLGVKNLKQLREIAFSRMFIKGETREWVMHRNLSHPSFNRKKG